MLSEAAALVLASDEGLRLYDRLDELFGEAKARRGQCDGVVLLLESSSGSWGRGCMVGLSRTWIVFVVFFSLSGCGALRDDKPPPTEIEIEPAPAEASIDFIAVASPLINPSANGAPAPIVLRLYQLSGQTMFANASFRQLWEADAETLGDTLLGKTELYLDPGGIQRIRANLIEGTVIVAVVAGFRNFEDAKWRAMVPLQGQERFELKATLTTQSVELGPQD